MTVQFKWKGYGKLAFSTNILFYHENGTRYGHSYNGRRIGTRNICDLSNCAISSDRVKYVALSRLFTRQ